MRLSRKDDIESDDSYEKGEARDDEELVEEVKKEEEERERARVRTFLRRQVQDWDDPVKAVARFKGFSGQRADWEGRYLFWRDLILNVARHLRAFIIRPSRLNHIWFRREGALSPLCLNQVLSEMLNAGDLLRESDLVDPASASASTTSRGRLSLIFWKAVNALGFAAQLSSSTRNNHDYLTEDYYILSALLKDKALEVVKLLSESHWTSSCVITLRKFQEMCGGSKESSAVLSYLSGCQKAKYLVITKNDSIEGLKVSLTPGAVSDISSLDYDVLHLIWTVENLEQQLDVIEHRSQKSKRSAIACLRSGNKKLAQRHAKELKLAFQSREKCTILLNRVEEVLRVIADADSSRKVSEAIELGGKAMRKNRISIEEVELSLEDINKSVESLKQVEEVIGITPAWAVIEDEDIEDELKMLEIENGGSVTHEPSVETDASSAAALESSENVDSLSSSLSNLNIKNSTATKAVKDCVSG